VSTIPSSRRWLVLQATAILESVAAENYVRYSGDSVPRYGVIQPAARPVPDPEVFTLSLALSGARQQTRLACPALPMKLLEGTEERLTWSGTDLDQHLQVVWVWDFFRVQSHVALRVLLPDPESGPAWRAAADALRAAQPGDQIDLDVQAASGTIHQVHTLTAAAVEWSA
jgi:hypothetical protein